MKRFVFIFFCFFIFISTSFVKSDCSVLKIGKVLKDSDVVVKKVSVYFQGDIKSKTSVGITNTKIREMLDGDSNRAHLHNCLRQMKLIRTDKENIYYLSVILSQDYIDQNINNIISSISDIYENFSSKPAISYGLYGIINKNMSTKQMKNKACEILFICNSKNIFEIVDDGMVSYTGMSPIFHDYISVNGNMENLNIALSSKNNKITEVWAYSPLIRVEY